MLWYFLLYYYLNISRYRFRMIFMLIALTCTTYLYIASHFPSLSHPFPLSLSLSRTFWCLFQSFLGVGFSTSGISYSLLSCNLAVSPEGPEGAD